MGRKGVLTLLLVSVASALFVANEGEGALVEGVKEITLTPPESTASEADTSSSVSDSAVKPVEAGSVMKEELNTMLMSMPAPVNIEVHTNFRAAYAAFDYNAITLSLQGDVGRLGRVFPQVDRWNGPISLAILARNSKDQQKVEKFWKEAPDKLKKYVSIHLCIARDKFESYPMNKMRNIAMRNVKTEWVYILDIDEDTLGGGMERHLSEIRHAENDLKEGKPAYVTMAWQWSGTPQGRIPDTRQQLQGLRNAGLVEHKSVVWSSYNPPEVSFDEWLNMEQPRKTRFGDGWEPYYIARTSQVVDFDPRFVGFGFNKRIQTLEMAANHFKFIVLPNVFTFADEDKSTKRRGTIQNNLDFFDQAFRELGMRYGCDNCGRLKCVSTCPDVFR